MFFMDEFDSYELELLRSKSRKIDNLKICDKTLICECNCVCLGEIKKYINSNTDFKYLAEKFNLGTGCKSCIETIKNIDLKRI